MTDEKKSRVLTVDTSRIGDSQSIVIGRSLNTECVDFAIEDDDYVSTVHVKITRNSMGVVLVEDMGSTNGSYFNGRRLMGDKMVINKPGGILRIGLTDIEVKLVDDWLSKVTSDKFDEPND